MKMTSPVTFPSQTRFGWLMPPDDEEKYSYLRTPQHRWVFWVAALAMAGVAVSFVGLATQSYWTWSSCCPWSCSLPNSF